MHVKVLPGRVVGKGPQAAPSLLETQQHSRSLRRVQSWDQPRVVVGGHGDANFSRVRARCHPFFFFFFYFGRSLRMGHKSYLGSTQAEFTTNDNVRCAEHSTEQPRKNNTHWLMNA
jgi:hypothetical protein